MPNSINNTLMLIGGASIGAVTMFLLDPDKGSVRRNQIANSAERAVGSTREAVNSRLQNASQFAQQAAADFRDRVGHTADDLSQHAHSVADHARKAAEDAIHSALGTARGYSDSANDYAASTARQARATHDNLMDRASSVYSRARSSVREQVAPSHPYATASGITAGTVGVLALGAGAMYLFDPARGASRRATLRDQFFSLTRRTGNTARGYGRHLSNQMKGAVHDATGTAQNWANTAKQAVSDRMPAASASTDE